MLYFREPKMDKLNSGLGIYLDYEKGCIRVFERIDFSSRENVWQDKKEIFSYKDLDADQELTDLIRSDENIYAGVSYFCMDMNWQ